MKNILIYSSALFLFLGCKEPFDLELDKAKPRLVIQGLIENNAGPHYIRITKSNVGKITRYDGNVYDENMYVDENVEGIEDATVIISDDTGQEEQLTLIQNSTRWYSLNGFYKTTNFTGVVGSS